jgi:CRISPR-associated protein Cas2
MTVIVLTACPIGLRGHLTRWLLEISPGVFVGKINSKIRSLLWTRVTEMVKTGRAIMVYNADNEQGLAFKVHAHEWIPIDFEGINLMLRPNDPNQTSPNKTGWSTTSKRRRYANRRPTNTE